MKDALVFTYFSFFRICIELRLIENHAIEIEMSAYSNARGSDNYNYTLSENRARSITAYILSKGISPNRIKVRDGVPEQGEDSVV